MGHFPNNVCICKAVTYDGNVHGLNQTHNNKGSMLRWAPYTQKQLRIMRLSRKVGILNATGVCHQTQSLEECAVSERFTASYVIAAIIALIPVVRRDINPLNNSNRVKRGEFSW